MTDLKFRQRVDGHLHYWGFIKRGVFVSPVTSGSGENPATTQHDRFIGIKDKNGKEIYEGDIVRLSKIDSLAHNSDRIVDVRFDDYTFAFWDGKNRFATVDYDHRYDKQNPREVIGNIYENPEILNATI